MRVILLQDVRGVGRRMEVKDVNDGHARNFLIPKKLATPFNADGIKIKNEIENKEKSRATEIKKYLKELAENPLKFSLKASDEGTIFGSIKREDIERELIQKGLKDVEVETSGPIKKIGENEVEVNFGGGVKEKIKILVSRR